MRWRLVAVLVGIVVLVLAAQNIPLARHLRSVERDRLITELERDAFTLAGRSATALDADVAGTDPAVDRMIRQYRGDVRRSGRDHRRDRHGDGVERRGVGGRARVRQPSGGRHRARAASRSSGERHSDTLDTDLVYVAVPVLAGDDVIGTVRITYPAAVISDRVDDRVRSLTVVAVITVAMAALVALVVSGTVTRPLRVAAPGHRAAGGRRHVGARRDDRAARGRSATSPRRSTGCRSGRSNSSTSSGRSPATPRTSCARR